MNLKLHKLLAYALMTLLVLGLLCKTNPKIKSKTLEPATTIAEVLNEIPEQKKSETDDYLIMTNENGT